VHGLRVVAIAAALLFTFSSHPVLAQEAPTGEETRALELFDSAAQKFREGRFREAIELLDEAYRLKPSAILRYNKARAYEGLGDESRAIVEYEAYLEMAPDARDRGAVERRLATLRAGIAERERLERERRLAAQRVRSEPAPAPKRRPSPRGRSPLRASTHQRDRGRCGRNAPRPEHRLPAPPH